MKTAKEMIDFASANKCKMTKAMTKGVDVVVQNLSEDEEVIYCIGAFAENESSSQIAFAITNLRIIAAQKKMFSDTVVTIPINHINDVTMKGKFTGDYITIGNTSGENLTISVYKGLGGDVANILNKIMGATNSAKDESKQENNVADEIRKFKSLLDDGIITEEEFIKKKKQLLGL